MVVLVFEKSTGQRLARKSNEIGHFWLCRRILGVSYRSIKLFITEVSLVNLDFLTIFVLLHVFHQAVTTCSLKIQFYRVGKIHKIQVEAVGFFTFPKLNRSISILMFAG